LNGGGLLVFRKEEPPEPTPNHPMAAAKKQAKSEAKNKVLVEGGWELSGGFSVGFSVGFSGGCCWVLVTASCCCFCSCLLLRILQRKSFVTLFSHFLQIVTGNEELADSVAAAFAKLAAKMLNKTCRKCATCQRQQEQK